MRLEQLHVHFRQQPFVRGEDDVESRAGDVKGGHVDMRCCSVATLFVYRRGVIYITSSSDATSVIQLIQLSLDVLGI